MVTILKNSQQLWLPARDLHQMKSAHTPARIGEELTKPHPLLRSECDRGISMNKNKDVIQTPRNQQERESWALWEGGSVIGYGVKEAGREWRTKGRMGERGVSLHCRWTRG